MAWEFSSIINFVKERGNLTEEKEEGGNEGEEGEDKEENNEDRILKIMTKVKNLPIAVIVTNH